MNVYNMENCEEYARSLEIPVMPSITISVPDVVDIQLQHIHASLVGPYKRKPVEGLTHDYIEQQRAFANLGVLFFGIVEALLNMTWNKTAFSGDILVRLQQILAMLANPRATESIVNRVKEVDDLNTESKSVRYRTSVGWENCYEKSALWGFGSFLRVLTAAYMFDMKEDWADGALALNEAELLEVMKHTARMDFECCRHNYNKYTDSKWYINAYERFLGDQDLEFEQPERLIEHYDPSRANEYEDTRPMKPPFIQRAIRCTRKTLDAIAGFACDIQLAEDTADARMNLDVIATSDIVRTPEDGMPMELAEDIMHRNARQEKLRALFGTQAAIPHKTFVKADAKSTPWSEYEKHNIFFTVPRMVRSSCLFQATANYGTITTLVSEFNGKSFVGDVFDGWVGLKALISRCGRRVLSMGTGKALDAFIEANPVDEPNIEFVLYSDLLPEQFLSDSHPPTNRCMNMNSMLSEFMSTLHFAIGRYPYAHQCSFSNETVVFFSIVKNSYPDEPLLPFLEAVLHPLLSDMLPPEVVQNAVQVNPEKDMLQLPLSVLMIPKPTVQCDDPLYWMSAAADNSELTVPAGLAGCCSSMAAVSNHFINNIISMRAAVQLGLNPSNQPDIAQQQPLEQVMQYIDDVPHFGNQQDAAQGDSPQFSQDQT